ncbi:[Pyruvate dehydrogenase (acetyl-transferring)] kinase 1, mitochondrial [Podochytrium sp. JEL0797]|nr:[Pyruvate dehydrogenase (acetyl-transferring)] kinase 1, mitochondrial [Podochytrium sp. JEL0797]
MAAPPPPVAVVEIMKVDSARQREDALAVQRTSVLARLLRENELVLMVGTVGKRRGLFTKKVGLMLTDFPRLAFFDPDTYTHKQDVQWTHEMVVECNKDNRHFVIKTSEKTYRLKDLEQHAERWVEEIRKCLKK